VPARLPTFDARRAAPHGDDRRVDLGSGRGVALFDNRVERIFAPVAGIDRAELLQRGEAEELATGIDRGSD